MTETDGVRVLTDDGWWLLRASNTQAVLVARAEAKTEAGLAALKTALVRQLAASGRGSAGFFGWECGALSPPPGRCERPPVVASTAKQSVSGGPVD